MSKAAKQLERLGDLWRTTRRVSDSANSLFVSWAHQLEEALLHSGDVVSTRMIGTIPALTGAMSEHAVKLAKRMEPSASESDSVVVESVPPALYRTAAIIRWLGESSAEWAEELASSMFNPTETDECRINERYRRVGETVSTLVREGVDTTVAGQSVKSQLREIRSLHKEQRKKAK